MVNNPNIDENGQDIDHDTADRLREGRVRSASHEDRDSAADARNLPRTSTEEWTWRRPSNLEAPDPRPGMVQRWVRAEFRNEPDNLNWQSKLREGWVPRDPATVPEANNHYNVALHQDKGVIRVGGLILMEAPEEMLVAKRKYIKEVTRKQEQSVAMQTEQVSQAGVSEGYAPIVRDERAQVSTGRRPTTLAD
jgi:hypothetical protein